MTERNRKVDELFRAEEHIKVLNRTIKDLLKRVQDLKSDIQTMINKKQKLARQAKLSMDDELESLKKEFNTGYLCGFQRGLAQGFFKGAQENQNLYTQKGI